MIDYGTPIQFQCICSTADGRISKGRIYAGHFAWREGRGRGWRIIVVDNFGQLMTFNPKVFKPHPSQNPAHRRETK